MQADSVTTSPPAEGGAPSIADDISDTSQQLGDAIDAIHVTHARTSRITWASVPTGPGERGCMPWKSSI